MPDHIQQHIFTYLIAALVVPMTMDKILIFPSRTERWVLLVLMGILWPLTLALLAILLGGAMTMVLFQEAWKRVRRTGAKIRTIFPKTGRSNTI